MPDFRASWPAVSGFHDSRFDPLRDAFREIVSRDSAMGSALSVWEHGREVVQLSAGWRDAASTMPWSDRTLVNVFSAGKPFAALAALYWVAQGAVELDEPVTNYWPEYGGNGKDTTTIRHILSHRSGLSSFPESARALDPLDSKALIGELAGAIPSGVPGTMIAEHALTYGHLIDGVLAGAGVDSVAMTLQKLAIGEGWDLWFAVPHDRLADVADVHNLEASWADAYLSDLNGTPTPYLRIPERTLELDLINSRAWRQHSFPAIGLHASASALGRFYSTLVDRDGPVSYLLGETLHREFLTVQADGEDGFLGRRAQWTLGFSVDQDSLSMAGIGGSKGWQVSGLDYSCGFVTRTLSSTDRAGQLRAVLESCLR